MKDPEMDQEFDPWEGVGDERKWVYIESRKKAILDKFALVREAEIREQRASHFTTSALSKRSTAYHRLTPSSQEPPTNRALFHPLF